VASKRRPPDGIRERTDGNRTDGEDACHRGVVVVIDGEGESWPAIAYYGVAAGRC